MINIKISTCVNETDDRKDCEGPNDSLKLFAYVEPHLMLQFWVTDAQSKVVKQIAGLFVIESLS